VLARNEDLRISKLIMDGVVAEKATTHISAVLVIAGKLVTDT
jgi:hypothetical protein